MSVWMPAFLNIQFRGPSSMAKKTSRQGVDTLEMSLLDSILCVNAKGSCPRLPMTMICRVSMRVQDGGLSWSRPRHIIHTTCHVSRSQLPDYVVKKREAPTK
jgi:hypothetical protein